MGRGDPILRRFFFEEKIYINKIQEPPRSYELGFSPKIEVNPDGRTEAVTRI
jgi:hypothetical protein